VCDAGLCACVYVCLGWLGELWSVPWLGRVTPRCSDYYTLAAQWQVCAVIVEWFWCADVLSDTRRSHTLYALYTTYHALSPLSCCFFFSAVISLYQFWQPLSWHLLSFFLCCVVYVTLGWEYSLACSLVDNFSCHFNYCYKDFLYTESFVKLLFHDK